VIGTDPLSQKKGLLMKATQTLETALNSTQFLLNQFVSDLSDADLLVRPVDKANHIAWQIGHLINSEIGLVRSQLPDAVYPELPAGFAEQHSQNKAGQESTTGFGTKEQYLGLFNRVREATKATLAKLSDTDLDRPSTGQMAQFAPTLGAFLMLVVNHTMMHAGQFSVVRRKLGKPVLF
jgi:DinB superfamily